MSDSDDNDGPIDAARALGSAIVGDFLEFWSELKRWVGSLRAGYKIVLIALGYFISDFLTAAARRVLTAAVNYASTAIGQANFTLTGFDFLFLIVYLQVIILLLLYEAMRRINKVSTELEDMATDQKRLDGGRVQQPASSSEPWLTRFVRSRAFLLANAGFVLGLFIGLDQAITFAATGALAGLLFPSH